MTAQAIPPTGPKPMQAAATTYTYTTNPTVTNDTTQGYEPGNYWLNTATGQLFYCAANTKNVAQWLPVSPMPCAFRNLIDGGDFQTNPWQRGTSFTAIANTLTYTADRWFAVGASTSSISVSQHAETDDVGTGYALRWGRANTDTAIINLGQVLETMDSIRCQGQYVTLSFKAKAGAQFSGGSVNVVLNHSTTAGNDTAAHLVAASTNWLAVPTIINGTFTPGTTIGSFQFTGLVPATATQLGLLFSYTPSGTSDTTDYVEFYDVQLEIGATATPFERRDVEVELAKAQRYCCVFGSVTGAIAGGAATSTTASGYFIDFPVPMLSAPTALTVATVADLSVYTYANSSVAALSGLSFGSASPTGCHATATVASGLTSGTPYVLYVATAKVGNVVFSCDL